MNDNRQLRVCQLRSLLRHRKVKSVVDGVNTRTGGESYTQTPTTAVQPDSSATVYQLIGPGRSELRPEEKRNSGIFFPKFLSLFSLSFSTYLFPQFSLIPVERVGDKPDFGGFFQIPLSFPRVHTYLAIRIRMLEHVRRTRDEQPQNIHEERGKLRDPRRKNWEKWTENESSDILGLIKKRRENSSRWLPAKSNSETDREGNDDNDDDHYHSHDSFTCYECNGHDPGVQELNDDSFSSTDVAMHTESRALRGQNQRRKLHGRKKAIAIPTTIYRPDDDDYVEGGFQNN